ncbi:MAG: hypothetical protein KJ675_16860 [Gammaproteobacteria bacterium]|nr:hypothetical protein [Gammaproteobacteria bacterium]
MNYDVLMCVYLTIYLLMSVIISTRLLKTSSDHFFYQYYIDLIRDNNHRFLTFFPNIINKTPVCDPQLIYACLSLLSKKHIGYVAVLLNPIVMAIMLLAVYIGLKLSGESEQVAFLVTALTSLVPQYYYLNNSRLAGLSGRGVGMMLFVILGLVAMNAQGVDHLSPMLLIIGAVLAWLIVASNIFAFQGLMLISAVLLLLCSDPSLFLMLAAGLILFVVINRHYSLQYLRGLWFYWMLYKNTMADRFILMQRPSVYRDFAYDFFLKFRKNKAEFVGYAYGNPILVLLFLSPVGIAIYYLAIYHDGINAFNMPVSFSLKITVGSLIAFLLISLRDFRFWGEPERYVELVIPFIVYFIVYLANTTGNESSLWYVAGYFLLTNFLQWLYYVIPRKIQQKRGLLRESKNTSLDEISKNIISSRSDGVILISNNQNIAKMLLNAEWKYVYYWPSIDNFDGYSFRECFKEYPFLTPAILAILANRHHATHVIFDSSNNDILPDMIFNKFNNIYNKGSLSLWARTTHSHAL